MIHTFLLVMVSGRLLVYCGCGNWWEITHEQYRAEIFVSDITNAQRLWHEHRATYVADVTGDTA
jgi:hypothetical protein